MVDIILLTLSQSSASIASNTFSDEDIMENFDSEDNETSAAFSLSQISMRLWTTKRYGISKYDCVHYYIVI